MRQGLRILAALLFLPIAPSGANAESFDVLNKNSLVYQGGVLMIQLDESLKDKDLRLYVFEGLYSFNKNGLAFVPVKVDQEPKEYKIFLAETSEDGERKQHDFYYTFIKVASKEFGTPWYAGPVRKRDETVAKQRAKEIQIMQDAYATANIDEDYTSGRYIMPLEKNEVTDQFGTLRLYGSRNRRTKKIRVERKVPHGGTDLRAKSPTPVVAINSGKVLLAHYFPLRGTEGNMLVIDHGSGILSLYLHLSQFKVKAGDTVTKGQEIALSGATPRGTPPHLHLMIKVHEENVDPLVFINDFNRFVDR